MKRLLLELSYFLKYPKYYCVKNKLYKNKHKILDELVSDQVTSLSKMLDYCRKHVPYYMENYSYLIDDYFSEPSLEKLSKFPIINKAIVNANHYKFISQEKRKYSSSSTGGSTGITLKYLLDYETTLYGRIINDRGWGYAGYKPGDEIVIFAGGSLIGKMNRIKSLKYKLANKKTFSSYGITEETMMELYKYINRKKVKYMYGYASSVYFFSMFLKEKNLNINNKLKGVFCTSEKLLDHQRILINDKIGFVFDDYGLNDGGVSAHECSEHNGLHIDFERSLLQVVDDFGNQISEGIGRVIATDLKNMKMPLIRYDTGDLARVTYDECKCGLKTPRLLEIIGRTTDYLKINGVYIGSPVLTVLMGKLDLKMYQIIQNTYSSVLFKIVLSENNDQEQQKCSNFITTSMNEHVKDALINIEYYDKIENLEIVNKHKFIINNTI